MYLGPDGMTDRDTLVAIFIFVAVLAVGMSIIGVMGVLSGDPRAVKKRLDKLNERHSRSASAITNAQMRRMLQQRSTRFDSMVGEWIPRPAELRSRLERSGKNISLGQYAAANGIVAVVASLVLIILTGLPAMLAILLGFLLGVGIPHMAVGMMIKRRSKKFLTQLVDAIDLLVRGLRSGLPISESLGVVGRELADPVGYEFRMVADKIRIGKTMDVALTEMANRLRLPEIQFFVIALAIQRETGGNLAETLNNLGEILRKRQALKLKIKALSSEAKASAYIVGALPFIMFAAISMLNPSYTAGFFTDVRLMMIGVGGMVWMSIGAATMVKMINFEI
jgi:tight adherence protein B